MLTRCLAAAAVLLGAGGCASGVTSSTAKPAAATHLPSSVTVHATRTNAARSNATPTNATPTNTAAATTRAQQVFAAMTDAERVGQLLMVGCPSTSVSSTCLRTIRAHHVGSVILDGNSTLSIAREKAVTTALQHGAHGRTRLFISTDQEGGLVRRMRGPGFTDRHTAVVQGTWSPSKLQFWATRWGQQLKAAGINVDLAPVLDTVPPGQQHNPPIGDLHREYGRSPSAVSAHGLAVARGLHAAGVVAAVKHFPGLGRVGGNTDTTAHVSDPTTTRTDPYLRPFAAAVRAKVPFVMMSTAIYSRIDARGPAAFSPTIVTGLLRHTLGFTGVVISDDLGSAKQVSGYPVGARAWRFVAAGGDIVLTVDAGKTAAMSAAILARMHTSAGFKKQVYAAVRRVLAAKQAYGLLS